MSSAHTLTTGIWHHNANIYSSGGHFIDAEYADDTLKLNPPPLPPGVDISHSRNLYGITDLSFLRSVVSEMAFLYWPIVKYYRLNRSQTLTDSLYGKAKEYIFLPSLSINMFVIYEELPDPHTKFGTDATEKVEAWITWKALIDQDFVPDKGDRFSYAGYEFLVTGVSAQAKSEYMTSNAFTYFTIFAEMAHPGYISED